MASAHSLPLEKDFQKFVLKKLREIKGSWWIKTNDRVTAGIPDIIGCVSGIFIAIELKTKSKLTPLQAYTIRRIDYANGQTFVATPMNWKEVYAVILKLADLAPDRKQF